MGEFTEISTNLYMSPWQSKMEGGVCWQTTELSTILGQKNCAGGKTESPSLNPMLWWSQTKLPPWGAVKRISPVGTHSFKTALCPQMGLRNMVLPNSAWSLLSTLPFSSHDASMPPLFPTLSPQLLSHILAPFSSPHHSLQHSLYLDLPRPWTKYISAQICWTSCWFPAPPPTRNLEC